MMQNQCSSTWQCLAHTTPERMKKKSPPLEAVIDELRCNWSENQQPLTRFLSTYCLSSRYALQRKKKKHKDRDSLLKSEDRWSLARLSLVDVIFWAYAVCYVSLINWHMLAEISSYRASESRAFVFFFLCRAVNSRTIVTGSLIFIETVISNSLKILTYLKNSRSLSISKCKTIWPFMTGFFIKFHVMWQNHDDAVFVNL